MASTSNHLGYLLEIQSDTTCFVSTSESNPPVTWGQTDLVEAVIDTPAIQSMTCELFSGGFGNSGMTLFVTDMASYLNERSDSSLVTTLTATLGAADTTVTVKSTAGFSPADTIWINQEAITYTGTTATTFTGCTRGSYGTVAREHTLASAPANLETEVFGYNPTWLGRKLWVKEFDQSDPSVNTTIFTGYIDGVSYQNGGFVLDMISVAQRLEEQSIGRGLNASGIYRTSADNDGNVRAIVENLGERKTASEIYIQLEDLSQTFPHDAAQYGIEGAVSKGKSHEYAGWIDLGGEIIKYGNTAYPGVWQYVITNGSDAFGEYLELQWKLVKLLRVGDTMQFEDSATSDTIRRNITKIDSTNGRVYYSGNGLFPAGGTPVFFPNLQQFSNLQRGQSDTTAEEHSPGAEVKRVHILEGDHVDVVLQAILSGNGEGGTYDILEEGIGAGLPSAEFNLSINESFDELRAYSTGVKILIDEPMSPKDLLVGLSQRTGGRIFVAPDGTITARRNFSLYPDTGASYTLGLDDILDEPEWSARIDQIYNQWSWETTQKVKLNFTIQDSVRLYGPRSLPKPDLKILLNDSFASVEAFAVATLYRYARPAPELLVSIPEESSNILQPGEIVAVTLPHLPNLRGTDGLSSDLFEVLEFSPSGDSVSIKLVMLPQQGNVGLLGPAGIVESKAGNDLVIKSSGTTYLSPSSPRSGALEDILGGGTDGTEDVDWFVEGDTVEIIDESTLGGTPTTTNMVVSSVDYPSRTLTMTGAVPAWVSDGDFIRLDEHTTVKASTSSVLRISYFTWWADETPEMPNGDDPYVWGM